MIWLFYKVIWLNTRLTFFFQYHYNFMGCIRRDTFNFFLKHKHKLFLNIKSLIPLYISSFHFTTIPSHTALKPLVRHKTSVTNVLLSEIFLTHCVERISETMKCVLYLWIWKMGSFDLIALTLGAIFLFKAFDFTFLLSFFYFFWSLSTFSLPWRRSSIPVSLLWVFSVFYFQSFDLFVILYCFGIKLSILMIFIMWVFF